MAVEHLSGTGIAIGSEATARVGEMEAEADVDAAEVGSLAALLEKLDDQLAQAPADQASNAKRIAGQARVLADEVEDPEQDNETIEFQLEGLERFTKRIVEAMPEAARTVEEIKALVGEMVGG